MKVFGLFLSTILLCSCGTKSNINQIWGGDDEGSDSMLVEAKAAYDSKDYSRAEKLTTKLLDRNPDNESAAIVLGYTLLSLGGIEPIQLARELIKLSATKTTEGAGAAQLAEDGDTSSSSSAATSTLTQLGSLINLSETDFDNLSEKTFDNDGSEPSLFSATENPLLVPAKISDKLREDVAVLGYMDRAIKVICRFVDVETMNKIDEPRHSDPSCVQTTGPRKKKAKAHFLWAFSHLTEALVYQSVILYSGAGGEGKSNFQIASDKINTKNYEGDIGSFVSEVAEMKNAVDAVFDTSSKDSMITGTLINLEIVNKAFSAIAGLPAGITEKISKSLSQLNNVSKSLGQTGVEGNTNALKGQMTEKFTKVIGEKIVEVADSTMLKDKSYAELEADQNPAIDPNEKAAVLDQVSKMCNSYDSLAKELPPEKNNKPETCTGAPAN